MAGYVDTRTVKPDEADVRLDRWFQRHFPQLTHGQVAKLLRTGQVRVDGKRALGNTRLQAGQIIRIPPLPPVKASGAAEGGSKARARPTLTAAQRQHMRALVLYEDDDVVIINKPAGLAVQGGTGLSESLDDWLPALQMGDERPKLVHRLDKETSGCLVIARNSFSAAKLTEAFRGREVEKTYLALAHGRPKQKSGENSAPLLKQGQRMVVDKAGDVAISHYQLLGFNQQHEVSALRLMPYTGRTHQLRVHAAHLGCPLLGDVFYGLKEADRKLGLKGLQLHSARVQVPHPRQFSALLDVQAPLPVQQQENWDRFGFKATLPTDDD